MNNNDIDGMLLAKEQRMDEHPDNWFYKPAGPQIRIMPPNQYGLEISRDELLVALCERIFGATPKFTDNGS